MNFSCMCRFVCLLVVKTLFIAIKEVKSQSQMGTAFYVTFLENRQLQENPEGRLYITSLALESIDITIVSPDIFDDLILHTLAPGETYRYDVPYHFHLQTSEFSFKGVFINASGEVTVQGFNMNTFTADGFLVLPRHALGMNHHVMTYIFPGESEHKQGPCMLAIIGTEEETEVTLTFPRSNLAFDRPHGKFGLKIGGKTMQFTMHNQEALQLQSNDDLTGTIITSSAPIAVQAGTLWTSVGHQTMGDHLVEQLPPDKSWGKEFFIVPVAKRKAGDVVRILAKDNFTKVDITFENSTQESQLLHESQFYDFTVPSEFVAHIAGNETILVAQFCKSYGADNNKNSDPFFSLVAPVERFMQSYVFTTPVDPDPFESFVSIIANSSSLDNIMFDKEPISQQQFYKQWTQIPHTTFSAATVSVPSGRHTIAEFPRSSGLGLVLYGLDLQTSYGMPLGQKFETNSKGCNNGVMSWADYTDNDCDGLYDEEIANGIDDDGDGLIDEDIYNDYSRRLMPWEKKLNIEDNTTAAFETTEVTTVEPTTTDMPSTEHELTTFFTTEQSTRVPSTSADDEESTTPDATTATESLTMKPHGMTTLMWLITTVVSQSTDNPTTFPDEPTTLFATTESETTNSLTTEPFTTEVTTIGETTEMQWTTDAQGTTMDKSVVISTTEETMTTTIDAIISTEVDSTVANEDASTIQSTTSHATQEGSTIDSSSNGPTGFEVLSSGGSSPTATATEVQNSTFMENITDVYNATTEDFGNFTNTSTITPDDNLDVDSATTASSEASKEEYNLIKEKPLVVILPAAIIVGAPLAFILYHAWQSFFVTFIRRKEEPPSKKKAPTPVRTTQVKRSNKKKIVPNVVFDATAEASKG